MTHPYVPPKLTFPEPDAAGLEQLETRLAQDLEALCQPAPNWVPPTPHPDGPVCDVLIIGGGMCGMLSWFALWRAGVRNTRIVDRSPEGFEGPWLTYARMETLRSPKTLPGPAMGLGSLTFQSWFRAGYGDAEWNALDKIPRVMWMDYLRWYRKALSIPVENNLGVTGIAPLGDLLQVSLSDGSQQVTRKVIMATGRDGTGRPQIPGFMDGVPGHLWAHSADPIDFAALSGKRVAVIGVGASAVDNAAEALEAGAAEVRHLIRRPEMPRINKMMGIGSPGFTNGYRHLNDEWRWRFMQYAFSTQTPPPRMSTARVSRHPNAHFHFDTPVRAVRANGDVLEIETGTGQRLTTDFVILGTGFVTDPELRREFGEDAGNILLWGDVYTPPAEEQNADLASFPYLNADFSFCEKAPGTAPWLSSVYCFNYGTSASMGKVSGDIPGVSEGAGWLSDAICATLYEEDIKAHWRGFQDYRKPELLGDEWTPTPLPQEACHDA